MVFSFVSDNTFCNYGLFIWMMKRFEIVGVTQKEKHRDRGAFLFAFFPRRICHHRSPREAVGVALRSGAKHCHKRACERVVWFKTRRFCQTFSPCRG